MRTLAALVLAGLALSARAEPSVGEARLLALVNAERGRHGVAALAWHEPLAELARSHAEDMRRAGDIFHRGSDGRGVVERVADAGLRFERVAENVARASSIEEAHAALLASPGHRRNLLDPRLALAGFAVAQDEGGTWVTQDFGIEAPQWTEAEARREVLRAVQERGWALSEDEELSRLVQPVARALAERDTASLKGLPNPGCWMLGTSGPDPSELPADRAPRCRATRAGIAVSWARTPTRPLGAWFVAITVAP